MTTTFYKLSESDMLCTYFITQNEFFLKFFGIFTLNLSYITLYYFSIHRDRAQTVNNVMGDAYGAGLIAHISKDLQSNIEQLAGDGDKTPRPNGESCITIDTSL